MISPLYCKKEPVKCYSISLTNDQRQQAEERKRRKNNKNPTVKKFDELVKNAKIRELQKRRNERKKEIAPRSILKIY